MPDATGIELIAHELRDQFPDAVEDTLHYRGIATLTVKPERVLDVLRWLRDTPAHRYHFLASVHGADYLPAEPRFGVHYELLNMERVERLHVKALLADPQGTTRDSVGGGAAAGGSRDFRGASEASGFHSSQPEIGSCVELFPTAEFQEREVYDMFGISFRGHPDLRRILMPDEYEGYPQRRDFPLGGEPVLFTHNEHTAPRWYE